jgi:hypothetical protein
MRKRMNQRMLGRVMWAKRENECDVEKIDKINKAKSKKKRIKNVFHGLRFLSIQKVT